MKISIFGLGYVGCVSLGCLARNGFKVEGVDVNQTKVDLINRGLATIIEKDIDKIISEQFSNERLSATTDYKAAVLNSDVSIICVGTPSTDSGSLNLDYIYETARQIGESIIDKKDYHLIVIRSTVLPGTNYKIGEFIAKESGLIRNKDFDVVSNPEFLREGSAVEDYYNPPYTLIGSDSKKASAIMRTIYGKIKADFIEEDIKTVELIKYVNNSYHALKVTFANEIGNICKKMNIDSHVLMNLFCMDKQLNISAYYFKPGFAYGGSCLPKDLRALKTLAKDFNLEAPILDAVEPSNQAQIELVTNMIRSKKKRKVGILGIAFKQGTDDLRYSPIVKVCEALLKDDFQIKVNDPLVNEAFLIGSNKDYIKNHLPFIGKILCKNEQEVIDWADTVIFNRKSPKLKSYIVDYPDKLFLDLVRSLDEKSHQNYEGVCW